MRKVALAALVFSSSSAFAEESITPAPAPAPGYELGVRVGGYGFRREGEEPWDECRMNGFGLFGARGLKGPLFLEAGLDVYTSVTPAQMTDLQLDRSSGLLSVAIGARTQIWSWLRAYAQFGTGLELTSVSVPYGNERIEDTKLMPEGFFGIGLELRLGKKTHFGASSRALVMGNFDYDPARLDQQNGWVAAPSSGEVFDASPDLAAQAQFYLRREL